MSRSHIFIYLILWSLIFGPLAGGVGMVHCNNTHHVDIGMGIDMNTDAGHNCCDSSFNETDHCHDSHMGTQVFVSSNNIRPFSYLNFAKLLLFRISDPLVPEIFPRISAENPAFQPPDQQLSHQSTVILLI